MTKLQPNPRCGIKGLHCIDKVRFRYKKRQNERKDSLENKSVH